MALLAQRKIQIRSMGVKLITVGVLAMAMTVPAWFVDRLVEDRSRRASEVSQAIGKVSGGPQAFLGPVLAVPYTTLDARGADRGVYVIFPSLGEADVMTRSEVHRQSLFRVTIYAATVEFKAIFDPASSPRNVPESTGLDWSRAEFITGVSDWRGAMAEATLTVGGKRESMTPSGLLNRLGLKILGVGAGTTGRPSGRLEVTASMKFSGSQKLSVLPFGETSNIRIHGDWADPGFSGGFLPISQSAGSRGFEAHWSIPFIARGIGAEGPSDLIAGLLPIAPAVQFVELADPYQSVTRSLKYALLFVGLVFSAFFVFETTTGKRVHPAQYLLAGVAQLIFYLLLLSIAERIGFGPAFAVASAATVSLISMDVKWIFESGELGARALVVFSLVYGLIYLLLTLEDEALLIGSIASFVATAAIMYFTRHIDWYSEDAPVGNT